MLDYKACFSRVKYLIHMWNNLNKNFTSDMLDYEGSTSHVRWKIQL